MLQTRFSSVANLDIAYNLDVNNNFFLLVI